MICSVVTTYGILSCIGDCTVVVLYSQREVGNAMARRSKAKRLQLKYPGQGTGFGYTRFTRHMGGRPGNTKSYKKRGQARPKARRVI